MFSARARSISRPTSTTAAFFDTVPAAANGDPAVPTVRYGEAAPGSPRGCRRLGCETERQAEPPTHVRGWPHKKRPKGPTITSCFVPVKQRQITRCSWLLQALPSSRSAPNSAIAERSTSIHIASQSAAGSTAREPPTDAAILPAVSSSPAFPAAARRAILAWYAERGRPLAFRRTTDPYAILVSEAMAQQTQAARAAEHWERFIVRFPTVDALAAASPADVVREWQGLGLQPASPRAVAFGAGHRRDARRAGAVLDRRPRGPARRRPVHGAGSRGSRVRGAGRRGRRQRAPRDRAGVRGRARSPRACGDPGSGGRRGPGEACRRRGRMP